MRKYYTEQDAEKVAMIYVRGTNGNQQFKKCQQYAEAKGYEVVGVIYDFERELFREIKEVDVIIVAGLHRIAENAEDYYSMEAALAEDGILIEDAICTLHKLRHRLREGGCARRRKCYTL